MVCIQLNPFPNSLIWLSVTTLLCVVGCGPEPGKQNATAARDAPLQQPETLAIVGPISFNQHVRPILSDSCFACHGPDADNQQSAFRLDSEEASRMNLALAGQPPRHGVVPGKPDQSQILARIQHQDCAQRMPPPAAKKQEVTPQEVAILRQWILDGARYERHWAFVPPVRPKQTAVKATAEIDRLVMAKLKAENMPPNTEAEPVVLLRRLYLTLTGLSPSPEAVKAFLSDSDPARYEKVVDQLLQQPACAERLTVDWLDAARYADSYGYQVDRPRQVWPWRDWVLDAFKNNLPYDQFILHQLAGDLIPAPTQESRIATAFNRLHMQKVEGGSVPEEFRVEYVADRAQTAATVFLGLTMECARCHDHKFDPITQDDYFGTFALFNNIDESGLYSFFTRAVPSPTMPVLNDDEKKQLAAKQEAVATALAELEAHRQQAKPAFQTWRAAWDGTVTLDPIASFNFDEAEGGKLLNGVAGQPDGALNANDSERVPGFRGNAVRMDGDSAVRLGRAGPFQRHLPFSISLRLHLPKTYELAYACGRTKAALDAGSRGYELLIDRGRLNFALVHFAPGNEIRIRSHQPVPLNSWQHITVSYDGSAQASGIQLYLNGNSLQTEVLKDHLTKEIYYSPPEKTEAGKPNKKNPELQIGARMRDVGLADASVDEFAMFATALSPLQVRALHAGEATPKDDAELFAYYVSHQAADCQAARDALAEKRRELNEFMNTRFHLMIMAELPQQRPTYVLTRGLYSTPDTERRVQPGPPTWLLPFDEDYSRDRLGFARWLVHPDHPLTARVTVNRYWQLIFGRGFVATANDFGSQGTYPSHPQLLDHLALAFIDSGWNLRALLKACVMSQTFRRDSNTTPEQLERDPHNVLLSRGPAMPMTAEMLRDNALRAADLLSPQIGGASVDPGHPQKSKYRRSLYTNWKRNSPSPEMLIFGAPRRQVCTVQREKTLTPLQPLVLMNSPQFVETARVLAARSLQLDASEEGRIQSVFFKLSGRPPSAKEVEVLTRLLTEQREYFAAQPEIAKKLTAVGKTKLDKQTTEAHSHGEIAAWTMVASTVLNLDAYYMVR